MMNAIPPNKISVFKIFGTLAKKKPCWILFDWIIWDHCLLKRFVCLNTKCTVNRYNIQTTMQQQQKSWSEKKFICSTWKKNGKICANINFGCNLYQFLLKWVTFDEFLQKNAQNLQLFCYWLFSSSPACLNFFAQRTFENFSFCLHFFFSFFCVMIRIKTLDKCNLNFLIHFILYF